MGLLNSKKKCGSQSNKFHCVRSEVSHTNDNVYMLHLTGDWSRVKNLCNVRSCVSPTRAGQQQGQVNC